MSGELWNLVNEWNGSESHERHICADLLAKSLLKERLSEWNKERFKYLGLNQSCLFTYSGDTVDLQVDPFEEIYCFKEQVSYD